MDNTQILSKTSKKGCFSVDVNDEVEWENLLNTSIYFSGPPVLSSAFQTLNALSLGLPGTLVPVLIPFVSLLTV
jgi:hypothetical protein